VTFSLPSAGLGLVVLSVSLEGAGEAPFRAAVLTPASGTPLMLAMFVAALPPDAGVAAVPMRVTEGALVAATSAQHKEHTQDRITSYSSVPRVINCKCSAMPPAVSQCRPW
jgi:hypothetical protein